MSVQLQATPSEGILGQTSLQLRFSYTTATGELVTGVNIQAKMNGQFKTLALFYTPLVQSNATLTTDGNYLTDRVTLINPTTTTSSDSAVILFSEIACKDEKEYMCQVAYARSSRSGTENSGVAHINVRAFQIPWPWTCILRGTSSLTLKIEQLDNNVIVRCQIVNQDVPERSSYKQTDPVNVYYSVRNVQVTKSSTNPFFPEGAGPITLKCTSDGNPAVTDYTWYKESKYYVPIGTGPTYVINNVVVTETDTYICVAQNNFNGQTFNMNNSIHIQIDLATTAHYTLMPITNMESTSTIYKTSSMYIEKGTETINVQMQATPSDGILGQTYLQLRCSYSTVTGEFVTGLNFQAKINGQFKNIAIFNTPVVPLNATLTPDGNYLTDRVTLTNPTSSLTTSAIMQFSQIACEDEKEYMCQVAYVSSSGRINTAYSGVAYINVKGNPEQPDILPSYVPSAGIEEGNNVVFTCTGDVGKPQGMFRWVRYRRNSNDVTVQETPYESKITTAAVMPGTCTYNGTSSLTLKMTQIDNNAVVRCQVVYQDVPQGSLYKQTFPINVYYSVRNVQVTQSPINPTFAEGAGPITLTCTSDGNPASINIDYTWHKESNTSVTLGTGPTYVINDVVVNETDNYICVVKNSFNGQTYNMNNYLRIQIGE
ncbi:uncharacterized protein LOC134699060 [Mytilus trossulus]|uniref:uncharacterized protein LOC134699060 n=1 Tax=Mytilus trossulus TaxID=6551 RepID=UPI0030072AEE